MTETITITRIGAPGELLPDPELFPEGEVLPGGFDAQGNPLRFPAASASSAGWYVGGSDGGGETPATWGDSDVMRITIYNRSIVDVRPTDQVTVRGRVWKVLGDIEPWVSPASSFAGTAVVLGRVG